MRRWILVLALVAVLATFTSFAGEIRLADPASVGMDPGRLGRITAHFQQYIDEERTAGIQLLVARHGRPVLFETLGFQDREAGALLTENSIFRIYSMTKPITGVAMMILLEEGKFRLGDPLAMHIPELAGLQVYAGENGDGLPVLEAARRAPTVHDLLRHTAGFTYGYFGDTPVDEMYKEDDPIALDKTFAQMVERLAELPLLFHPGERWHYSIAVDIQGYLVEKLSGKPFDVFLQERIFDPLGMTDTHFVLPEAKRERLATVYTHDEEGDLVRFEEDWVDAPLERNAFVSGGAGLVSTTHDYWRFATMLAEGGALDGARILSPRTVELMASNHLPAQIDCRCVRPGLGFGIDVAVVTDAALLGAHASEGEYHWGGLASTVFWIDPRDDVVVVLMTQYMPGERRLPSRADLRALVRASIVGE